ncbi:NAD(P) transhydrogenase subunit alpha [Faunimonas pinastri]|uniref:proton-translocating NAD(P)(+) transhydrogenase n=1 Tax=Faunimonas pinastri TaxID=1855383 RepID=A0A1H8Z364_9HYPH|nr:NAD(P) transhydrogenase subunit alpha [Faunimonas pinastri]SEP58884.1 NAD(P) transhydrogenase subunit alpha [Faunimonas pinastri]
MASIEVNQAVEQARAAADAAALSAEQARHAAEQAATLAGGVPDGLADAAGAAVHMASGGLVDPFIFRLSIFVLAIFVGYYVVWQVTPALHTPLMSVTNAISSVVIVGALLAVGVDVVGHGTALARGFGFFAVLLASVNIFGGFLVTQRMLAMYKKKDR